MVMTGARFATRISQLLSFVLLARILSPEGFGAYGVLTSAVFLIGLIGNFGIRQSTAQLIGSGKLTDGEAGATALLVWPLVSALGGGALWLIYRDEITLLAAEQLWALIAAVSAILFLTFLQGVFLGRGDTGQFALAETAPRAIQTVLVVALAVIGSLTVGSAMFAFAASFVVRMPYVAYLAFRPSRRRSPRPRMLPAMIGRGFVFSLSLFLIMLQGRVGLFALHGQFGEAIAGQFFAAQRVSEIFLDLATAAGLVLFSDASRSSNPKAAVQAALGTASVFFVVFAVAGIAIGLLSPLVIRAALGPGYERAVPALQILGFGLAPVAAARIMNSVVSGVGRPGLSASIAAIGVPINLAICYVLASRYGAAGAAIGLVVGQSVACLGYIVLCRFMFDVKFRDVASAMQLNSSEVKRRLRRFVRR